MRRALLPVSLPSLSHLVSSKRTLAGMSTARATEGKPITVSASGQLVVPENPIIPYIEGDGIGQEVTDAAIKVFDAAVAKTYGGRRVVHWMELLAGDKAVANTAAKTPLPEETLEAFRTYLVGLKGPLGTPVGGGMRSLNVALRQQLDLYVCQRPVRYFPGVGSPLRHPERVAMTIFRENTEDIYAGIEWEAGTPEAKKFSSFLLTEMGVTKVRFPESSGYGVKPVSRDGTQRLVRSAIEYAVSHKLPTMTIVHKGNIMKYTEGGFKQWGYDVADSDPELAPKCFSMNKYDAIRKESGKPAADAALTAAKEAGKVIVNDCIADAFLQNTLLKPRDYSVIATLNLNGDYISDQLAAMVGGIGIAPGGNMNYKTGHAIFEATHGTAPDIAGQQKANPCSIILSGIMMFDYLGWKEVGATVEAGLEKMFAEGKATCDLTALMKPVNGTAPTTLSTDQFVATLISKL